MTGQEAVNFIHERAWTGRKPGLSRTFTLLERLGSPHEKLKFVHITGTNGKGSTAAMVSSILTQAGLRTGLYTSPHLWTFHERFQVDGVPISDAMLGELGELVIKAGEGMEDPPTEFELMTALGLEFFLRMKCDIVVLEVGLGGRLDSTNVIPAPEAAVITNIGLEHTQELGNSRTLIAQEKSGIIKKGCSTVLDHHSGEVEDVVKEVCRQMESPLTVTAPQTLEVLESNRDGQTFRYRGKGPYHISLLGPHQLYNAMTALDTIWTLSHRSWKIEEQAVAQGLENAVWPARLELVRRNPDILLDGGHNPQCMAALHDALEELYPGKKMIFLTGVLGDKDYPDMINKILPLAKSFVTITPDSPRALSAQELADYLHGLGIQADACETTEQVIQQALALAGPEDVVCACGSLYMIGEVRHLLGLC